MVSRVKARERMRIGSNVVAGRKAVILTARKKKRVLSKSKVDFLILFACSIPSTAAGGSLYMSFIHSLVYLVASKHRSLQSYSSGHDRV
jgi:hypothetical protein